MLSVKSGDVWSVKCGVRSEVGNVKFKMRNI